MDSFVRNFLLKYSEIIKSSSSSRLLKILSAIEYIEAIFEITASKLFGDKFKWFIIVVTQLTKFHKIGIQPLVQLFTLKTFLGGKTDQNNNLDNHGNKKFVNGELSIVSEEAYSSTGKVFKLKHSNRIIRSLHNSPELNGRDWKLNSINLLDANDEYDFDPNKDLQHLAAELLYICRPICHLILLYTFRSKSWVQFIVPFFMDTTSLLLIGDIKKLSKKQRHEVKRRTLLYLNYFLRSPLYDIFSKSMIDASLNLCEQNLPLITYIAKPLRNYIPQWQSVYNYCWSS